jgi:hypothetical protein
MGVKPGVSDIMLPVRRGNWPGLFIELKKPKLDGKKDSVTQPEQKVWGDHFISQGYGFVVCYGWHEAQKSVDTIFGIWEMISTLQEMNDRIKKVNKDINEKLVKEYNKMKIRVQATFDEGMRYGCEHHSHWQTKPCKECEYEDRMGNYNGHEDQLKIKMPPDWDKDKPLLTRQEAIKIWEKNYVGPYATNVIGAYVALGMLKLKEEKKVDPAEIRAIKEAEDIVKFDSIVEVSNRNIQRLVRLIEELLNIIKLK